MTPGTRIFVLALVAAATAGIAIPDARAADSAATVEALLRPLRTEAELNEFLGAAASSCLAVAPARRLCQWKLSRREVGWSAIAQALGSR